MTILEFKRHFKQELSEIYSESESAELFQIFAHEVIGFDVREQRKNFHENLLIADEEELYKILNLLKTGKPYQQILGKTEFYGLEFFLDENVLIPRPETEELLEFAISNLKSTNQNPKIIDIGTGSGIIPIVLKKHFPDAEISAIDISEKALEIAGKNAAFHKTEINFFQHDFFSENLTEKFDVIISNPPYIGIDEDSEIVDSVKGFEPRIALFSPTSDALIFYRKIAEFSNNFLSENGMIFLEINQKLGIETLELFDDFPEKQLIKDISGNDRIVFAKKN